MTTPAFLHGIDDSICFDCGQPFRGGERVIHDARHHRVHFMCPIRVPQPERQHAPRRP